jgi:hypothetical protein
MVRRTGRPFSQRNYLQLTEADRAAQRFRPQKEHLKDLKGRPGLASAQPNSRFELARRKGIDYSIHRVDAFVNTPVCAFARAEVTNLESEEFSSWRPAQQFEEKKARGVHTNYHTTKRQRQPVALVGI